MEKTITKEMMHAARTYLPLEEKTKFVRECAPRCFDRLKVELIDGEEAPPLYMVNSELKGRYLMGALIRRYLGIAVEHEETDEDLMTAADYDLWAGSHAVNQIERWKSDRDLRDRCFDLLADYHDLEKRLNAEIQGMLTAQNDPVTRQSMMTRADMERLPALLEEVRRMQEARAERK